MKEGGSVSCNRFNWSLVGVSGRKGERKNVCGGISRRSGVGLWL